ncbi:MAG TPA: hydantoinase/oxoprolinase family protein [Gaiellales bacterium]|jgi:N-methylhydantoinase A/oxoprolinase/acetone carboxylase beta subunit
MRAIVGVDVGGTFTDVALVAGGGLVTAKVPTTTADQSRGVVEGIALALERAGLDARDVGRLGHGTTVATNALLERRGARCAFVATAGFGDLLTLARQTRPHLYRLDIAPPAPLAEVTAEVDERTGPDGVLRRLRPESVDQAARRLRRSGVDAVAVCLLHSYAHPGHERETARLLRHALPGVRVVASVDVAPEFREYERASTAVADAYLGPVAGRYLERLGRSAKEHGLPEPDVMQSSGGVCALAEAAAHPVRLLLSGPAGGVAAVKALGAGDSVSFDMGGTSTDVCLIRGGEAGISAQRAIAGLPMRVPHVDIHTVGAGGGSIAWLDEGGALRVGPQSAGAEPGPAAYGRGGELPTVTDANVVLGRLDPKVPLAGGLRLDAAAARVALRRVAGPFRSLRAAAEGIVAVANEEMVRAIRVVSVEQGHDPRGFDLVAFGGAGPLHACDVAELLGMRAVVVPAAGGVLSALGIAAGDRRTDVVESVMEPLSEWRPGRLRGEAECELRYRGQAHELAVPVAPRATLAERFHARHRERYGFDDPHGEVEVVSVRTTTVEPGPQLELPRTARTAPVKGPASVPLDGATMWVGEGWTARRRPDGSWRITR